jgi:type IV pilus assembly protein PilW
VTALKIYVLSRGREPTPGWSDTRTYSLGSAPTICSIDGSCTLKTLDPTFKRQMFSTTVRLANVVQRRETP